MTYTEKIKETAFYERYEDPFLEWGFKIASLAESEEIPIIAIARKCPRLFELFLNEIDPFFKEIIENLSILTEHALPFYFAVSENISKEFVLCDDSVLYGSTFCKIEKLINTYYKNTVQKVDIKINEVVLFKLDGSYTGIEKLNYFIEGDEKEANTFVNLEMSAFLENGPYDLEFPIFYASGKFEPSQIKKYLEDIFIYNNCSIYESEEPVLYSNKGKGIRRSWTVLFNAINERNRYASDPEFSKIRFFLNNDCTELRIVPFSPYPLSIDFIKHIEFQFPPEVKDLISIPYSLVYAFLNVESTDDDDTYMKYQTERSLIIWTNYLLSINFFLSYKTQIDSFLKKLNTSTEIHIKDLNYLLGSKLAKKILPLLQKWIFNGNYLKFILLNYKYIYTNYFNESLIPKHYYRNFIENLSSVYKKYESINELIAIYFFYQHKSIDLASRFQNESFYKRLRFGTTFKGLYNFLISLNFQFDIGSDIHKCIDKQIDEGSAVPKYICLDNDHNAVWVRMFRPGERISKVIERQTLLYFILYKIKNNIGTSIISKILLESFLLKLLTFTEDNSAANYLYDLSFKRELKTIRQLPVFCAAIDNLNKTIPVSSWLEKKGVLQDLNSFYEIKTENMQVGLICPYENEIDEYVNHLIKELSLFHMETYKTNKDLNHFSLYISSGLTKKEFNQIRLMVLKNWSIKFEKLLRTENEGDIIACYSYLFNYYINYMGIQERETYQDANSSNIELEKEINIAILLNSSICLLYKNHTTIIVDEKAINGIRSNNINELLRYHKTHKANKSNLEIKNIIRSVFDEMKDNLNLNILIE